MFLKSLCHICFPKCNPPSINIDSPVMSLFSVNSQRVSSAISRGLAAAFSGTVDRYFSKNCSYFSGSNRFECHSVSISAGQMALIFISGASALASATVIAFKAALDAIYAVDEPMLFTAAIEDIFTIDPLVSFRWGAHALII